MTPMTSAVKTRFAPSPTGYLHVGSVRTALFNLLYAMRTGGKFILRVEDTDLERSKPEFEQALYDDLNWLGITWDDGPYRQSERLDLYREYAGKLLENGRAYKCWCTKERLEELKKKQLAAGTPPRYDGRCRGEKQGSGDFVVRFAVPRAPEKQISFIDGVHGAISVDAGVIGDFILIGSDKAASYNFAAVVDDALMAITHIIRGDDHISNTARQALLFEALGFNVPMFAHIPLVLSPEKTPLSKRDTGSSIRALRNEGYLPEAIIDSTARLGWSLDDDILTINDMADIFAIERLSKSPSVFDIDRLKYTNKKLIRQQSAAVLIKRASLNATQIGVSDAMLEKAIDAVKTNATTLNELSKLAAQLIGNLTFSDEAQAELKSADAKSVICAFLSGIEKATLLDEKAYNDIITSAKKTTLVKSARLFMPIRCALTGSTKGIELHRVIEVLGKEKTVERLKKWL